MSLNTSEIRKELIPVGRKPMTKEEQNKYLNDCLNVMTCRNVNFDEWDKKFISNIHEKVKKQYKLTERQKIFLKKIWNKI